MSKFKSILSKVLQSRKILVVLALFLFVSAGVAQAAFLRTTGDSSTFGYGYGYGYAGYGYGYGPGGNADYGFSGTDGKASFSATATRTTITVSHTTSYKADNVIKYGLDSNVDGGFITLSDQAAGTYSNTITGLTCNTTYYYRVESTDAGDTLWGGSESDNVEVETSACSSGSHSSGSSNPANPALGCSVGNVYNTQTGKLCINNAVPQGCSAGNLYNTSTGQACVNNVGNQNGHKFGNDLKLGSNGNDVIELQKILVTAGYLVMPDGVPMGYFGVLTRSAVIKYQLANGIVPSVGYVGPITNAKLNEGIVSNAVVDLLVSLGIISPDLAAILKIIFI